MKLTLIEKRDEAKGTKSFFWEPEREVKWLPGQYYYYTLPKLNYPDPRGTTRHFTISSSPTEGELLRLTTRIREESGFKKTLDEIQVGDSIEGEGPNGTFILDEKQGGSQVFLAGGIGITPFRSFIKYAADKKMNVPMHLVYSNSDSDFTYKKEFDSLAKENSFLKIDYIDSSKLGHMDEKMLKNLAPDPKATFWVVGPPPFVSAMEDTLTKMGIPDEQTRTEKFTGY